MKLIFVIILLFPAFVFAQSQSGSIGGGAPQPEATRTYIPPLETSTERGTGSGLDLLSKLQACAQARKDGNDNISLISFRLSRTRIIKGDNMSDCMCEGPASGGWYRCTVSISVTHTNR